MSLKNLLVHVDAAAHSDARVALAVEFARRHDAHLTGLYVLEPKSDLPAGPAEIAYGGAPALLAATRSRDRLAAAARQFQHALSAAGVTGDWRVAEGWPEEVVALQARYADLAILGQSDPDDALDSGTRVATRAVLTSGRPAIVVPYAGSHESIGGNIVVAWTETRESARALNDAMPILVKADKVTVLVVNPGGAGYTGDGMGGAADIALHLARHGVNVEAARIESPEVGTGDMILNRAFDLGADLLVTGAYGHSQLREAVFGGVTRSLLDHMTLPVLLAH